MFSKKLTIAVGVAIVTLSSAVKAGDIEDTIVAKVTAAYGGRALISAKSIKITDYNKSPWPGQGESPKQPDFFRDNAELTIDFDGKRKSMLSWRVSRTAKDLERFVFDGTQGRVYDILNFKYTDDTYYSYETIGRSVIRASDTMIARSLTNVSDTAIYQGEASYLSLIHI